MSNKKKIDKKMNRIYITTMIVLCPVFIVLLAWFIISCSNEPKNNKPVKQISNHIGYFDDDSSSNAKKNNNGKNSKKQSSSAKKKNNKYFAYFDEDSNVNTNTQIKDKEQELDKKLSMQTEKLIKKEKIKEKNTDKEKNEKEYYNTLSEEQKEIYDDPQTEKGYWLPAYKD